MTTGAGPEGQLVSALQHIVERPEPWARSTNLALWTRPHLAEQMLRYHLDGSVDAASRRASFIEASLAWITQRFEVGPGTRVADLGCGPGLYANPLARSGARVTGVDFSGHSLDHARARATRDGIQVSYVEADYLAWDPVERFDLITLIFCDYCALDPVQRTALLARVHDWLAPGGAFLFDVHALAAFAEATAESRFVASPAGGFWSPEPYFEFHTRFRYEADHLTLDKHTIVEASATSEYFGWLQYFSPEALTMELAAAGLSVEEMLSDVAGRPFDPTAPELAVIARVHRA